MVSEEQVRELAMAAAAGEVMTAAILHHHTIRGHLDRPTPSPEVHQWPAPRGRAQKVGDLVSGRVLRQEQQQHMLQTKQAVTEKPSKLVDRSRAGLAGVETPISKQCQVGIMLEKARRARLDPRIMDGLRTALQVHRATKVRVSAQLDGDELGVKYTLFIIICGSNFKNRST